MEVESMKELGNRLKILREGTGFSQAKFAEVIGSTQSRINRYENGQATPLVRDNPELAKFVEMCFDPGSPMNEKLKQTMLQMLKGVQG